MFGLARLERIGANFFCRFPYFFHPCVSNNNSVTVALQSSVHWLGLRLLVICWWPSTIYSKIQSIKNTHYKQLYGIMESRMSSS